MRGHVRWRDWPSEAVYAPNPRARRDDEVEGLVHTFICPACHAILKDESWFVDEALYRQLDGQPGVRPSLCPGCLRVVRGRYEGEVVLQSPLLALTKAAALQLIGQEELRAHRANPMSRVTAVEDRGDEITVLTTTTILAERIGRVFRRMFDGRLEIQRPPVAQHYRVHWQHE